LSALEYRYELVRVPARAAEWTGRKQSSHASGNGPKWEWVQVGIKPAFGAEWIGLTGRPHSPAHARTGARAAALDPYQRSGIVGNNTTLLVALAAGFGGAFVCSLVVVIVMILRNRRAARAVDPAPGLRTPLYSE
jgi:hypothetical protein